MVGLKLAKLAKQKQIFCVTHLPQVAAFGETHFFVEKGIYKGIAAVSVRVLDSAGREAEVARMLGGKNKSTKASLAHARELLAESRVN